MEFENEQYVIPIFHDADVLVQVKGDLMYPKYNNGDIVACKSLSLDDLFFQWDKVYVLETAQGSLVKRIKKGKDLDHILLVNENESFEAFELSVSKIFAVALVIGVIRLV
jgi:phage repressor protein C with HTH and peptisase S24 domain